MNIRNTQSYEFEQKPMFSLSVSKIGWILYSNTKETLQKMLARKYSYRGKYMKDWKKC